MFPLAFIAVIYEKLILLTTYITINYRCHMDKLLNSVQGVAT